MFLTLEKLIRSVGLYVFQRVDQRPQRFLERTQSPDDWPEVHSTINRRSPLWQHNPTMPAAIRPAGTP